MKLDKSDRMLRYGNPVGMEQGVKEIIIRHCGFELYNTRPYHNYETWSDGYVIIWRKDGKTMLWDEIGDAILGRHEKDGPYFTISKEDLDEAILAYLQKSGREEKFQRAEFNLTKSSRKYEKTESLVEKGLFSGN